MEELNGMIQKGVTAMEMSEISPPVPVRIEPEQQEQQEDIDPHRFRFLSAREIYSMTGPTDWLVKSYLDKGSLAMLFGQSGAYKSFVAIDIGLCVATGTEWHGNPVSQGTVFYICGEGQKGIARRLKAWEVHHGDKV